MSHTDSNTPSADFIQAWWVCCGHLWPTPSLCCRHDPSLCCVYIVYDYAEVPLPLLWPQLSSPLAWMHGPTNECYSHSSQPLTLTSELGFQWSKGKSALHNLVSKHPQPLFFSFFCNFTPQTPLLLDWVCGLQRESMHNLWAPCYMGHVSSRCYSCNLISASSAVKHIKLVMSTGSFRSVRH